MGDLGDDLQPVLATAQHAENLAVAVARTTIDLVRDQHRSTVFQPPNRPNMRQATSLPRDTLGKDVFGSLSLGDFVLGGHTTESSLWLAPPPFLTASLLSLFFRSSGEWLVDLRRRRVAESLLELLDASVRGFKFA